MIVIIAVLRRLWAKIVSPLYWFHWYRWRLYQRRLKAKPRAEITNGVTIYAHEFGSDLDGDGRSVKTAYRTFLRASRDIPTHIPPGTRYAVDVTGLHKENLPTDYSVFASEEDEQHTRVLEKRERDIKHLQDLMTSKEKP